MRNDPIFGLPVPLLFAHRGGAGEVPESTELAFRHAVSVGADVLELDLSLTRDDEIVLWHGPGLDNVYLGGQPLMGVRIEQVNWTEMGDARVVHPRHRHERVSDPARGLLAFSDFVALVHALEAQRAGEACEYKVLPWNIELKGSPERWQQALPRLLRVLDAEAEQRKIVLAAQRRKLAIPLREAASRAARRYAFNVTLEEQLAYTELMQRGPLERLLLSALDTLIKSERRPSLEGFAFQTSYRLVSEALVREVHERGGAVHAFLTGFGPLKGVDEGGPAPLRTELARLSSVGVDGIMTDYPEKVAGLLRLVAASSPSLRQAAPAAQQAPTAS